MRLQRCAPAAMCGCSDVRQYLAGDGLGGGGYVAATILTLVCIAAASLPTTLTVQDFQDRFHSKLATMRSDHSSLRSALNNKRLEAEALKEEYAKACCGCRADALWVQGGCIVGAWQTGCGCKLMAEHAPPPPLLLQECKRNGKLVAEHEAAASSRRERDRFIRDTAAALGIALAGQGAEQAPDGELSAQSH